MPLSDIGGGKEREVGAAPTEKSHDDDESGFGKGRRLPDEQRLRIVAKEVDANVSKLIAQARGRRRRAKKSPRA